MTPQAAQPKLGSTDFFLAEIVNLIGQFQAGEEFDDWDLARGAFEALAQNAWAAHALRSPDAPLICPLVKVDPERDLHWLEG